MAVDPEWFDPTVVEAKFEHYTWHKNRHTCASRLAIEGMDIRAIAQLIGHATIGKSVWYPYVNPDHNQFAVNWLADFKSRGHQSGHRENAEKRGRK